MDPRSSIPLFRYSRNNQAALCHELPAVYQAIVEVYMAQLESFALIKNFSSLLSTPEDFLEESHLLERAHDAMNGKLSHFQSFSSCALLCQYDTESFFRRVCELTKRLCLEVSGPQRSRVIDWLQNSRCDFAGIAAAARDALVAKPITYEEVHEVEKVTDHDLVAILTVIDRRLQECLPSELLVGWQGFLHLGFTSQDVKDTSLAICLFNSRDAINDAFQRCRSDLSRLVDELSGTTGVARTHGQYAKPTDAAHGLAVRIRVLIEAVHEVMSVPIVGKVSGAVGDYGAIPLPEMGLGMAASLGIPLLPASLQTAPRFYHLRLVDAYDRLAWALQDVAYLLFTLCTSEVAEMKKRPAPGSVGSSAMPQKANPWKIESCIGACKLVHSLVDSIRQGAVGHQHRDLSHLQTETVSWHALMTNVHYMFTSFEKGLGRLAGNPARSEQLCSEAMTLGVLAEQYIVTAAIESSHSRLVLHEVAKEAAYSSKPLREELSSFLGYDMSPIDPSECVGVGTSHACLIATDISPS